MSVFTANTPATITSTPICSVIVPVYNSGEYLEQAFESVLTQQNVDLSRVELILYNDASTDNSLEVANRLKSRLSERLLRYLILDSTSTQPSGVGSARNRCCEVAQSTKYIFLDSDDVMQETRIARSIAILDTYGVVGGNFQRIPKGSTPRYEAYHRRLTHTQVNSQVYTFRDTPIAMPTVGCTKCAYNTIGGFVEGRGVAEDLRFIYKAIECGIELGKIEGEIVTYYRYHSAMTSLSLRRELLMSVRVNAFETIIMRKEKTWLSGYSIWGAGRDGKQFYKYLTDSTKRLLEKWGDIDPNKIGTKLRNVPVVHWSELTPPIVICVALDRDGELEKNIQESGFVGGKDYFHLV